MPGAPAIPPLSSLNPSSVPAAVLYSPAAPVPVLSTTSASATAFPLPSLDTATDHTALSAFSLCFCPYLCLCSCSSLCSCLFCHFCCLFSCLFPYLYPCCCLCNPSASALASSSHLSFPLQAPFLVLALLFCLIT